MPFPAVPETDVLIQTTLHLVERGLTPYQFSVPRGSGIDNASTSERLSSAFHHIGLNPSFVGSGPDIIAASEDEWWQIECKGIGNGQPATHRNNFDRALASTVSYFERESPPSLKQRGPRTSGWRFPPRPTTCAS